MWNHELDAIEQVDYQCPGNRYGENEVGQMLLVGWQYKQGGKRSDKQDRSKLAIPAGLDDDLAFFQEKIAADHHHEFLGKNEGRNPGRQTAGQGHGQSRCQLENLVDKRVKDASEVGCLIVMPCDVAIQDVCGPDADKKTNASVLCDAPALIAQAMKGMARRRSIVR